jgi:hypothetical protein
MQEETYLPDLERYQQRRANARARAIAFFALFEGMTTVEAESQCTTEMTQYHETATLANWEYSVQVGSSQRTFIIWDRPQQALEEVMAA